MIDRQSDKPVGRPVDLDSLFHTELEPLLKSLDTIRVRARNLLIAATAIAIPSFLILFFSARSNPQLEGPLVFSAGSSCFALFLAFTARKASRAYRDAFKSNVLSKMISVLFPGFQYAPGQAISPSIYISSGIFQQAYDRYDGEDRAFGKIRETDIEFSELHTRYMTTTTNSKGGTQTQWHTIFQGIFVSADFHKHFQSETYVFPDTAERLFGSFLGGLLQKASTAFEGRGERIELENPEFEKCFVVMSKNAQEARYILTPKMMESILALKNKFRNEPYLSFVGGRVYIAISTSHDHFEPNVWRGVDKSDIADFHRIFATILSIVDELELNTRIWSK